MWMNICISSLAMQACENRVTPGVNPLNQPNASPFYAPCLRWWDIRGAASSSSRLPLLHQNLSRERKRVVDISTSRLVRTGTTRRRCSKPSSVRFSDVSVKYPPLPPIHQPAKAARRHRIASSPDRLFSSPRSARRRWYGPFLPFSAESVYSEPQATGVSTTSSTSKDHNKGQGRGKG